MEIAFKPFTKDDAPLYFDWCERPHVKEKWFREGYEPKEIIWDKIAGTRKSVPFVIMTGGLPIGYIQYYPVTDESCEALQNQPRGTVGFDIFIGEESYVGNGTGTQVVIAFTKHLFSMPNITKIIVDPFADDKRAIRCYEKAGFSHAANARDDIGTEIAIMEKNK